MSGPDDQWPYIVEVAKRAQRIERFLENDVIVMCELLYQVIEVHADRLDEETKRQFADIYWSLKLHLLFHLGAQTARNLYELDRLGRLLNLTAKELYILPNEERAIDPGSKFLEIVGINFLRNEKRFLWLFNYFHVRLLSLVIAFSD